MSEAMKLAKEVQAFAGKQLYVDTLPAYTDVAEWNLVQQQLVQALAELNGMKGSHPDEEGELVLAILMGYGLAVRNARNVQQALQRAERVMPCLTDAVLKCKLAVHCYVEFPDEELATMVQALLHEVKGQGRSKEVQQVENFFRMIALDE